MTKYGRWLRHKATDTEIRRFPTNKIPKKRVLVDKKPPIFEVYKYQMAIRTKRLELYIGWWYVWGEDKHIFGYRYTKIGKTITYPPEKK